MHCFFHTAAALLCATFLASAAAAQSPANCNHLKQALDQRAEGFKGITGERVGQDGVLAILASKGGTVFLRRALIHTAPGIPPVFISETEGINTMQEAAAQLLAVAGDVQSCMPALRAIQDGNGEDSSLRMYFVDEQGRAPIMGQALYDAGRRFFVTQLRIETSPVEVPADLARAAAAPAPAPPGPAMLKPCEAVKVYVAAGVQDFKPLRGSQLAPDRWESNIQIQGYSGAYVLGTDTAALMVPITNPTSDPTEYDVFYQQFNDLLKDCLKGWARSETDNDVEAATYNNAYYVSSPRTVTLALHRRNKQYQWVLEVR